MEYNSTRPKLLIPEYGRNLQKMVEYTMNIKDRVERNNTAYAIVDIMASISNTPKNSEEERQKLWDQLYALSDYKIDIDGEFPATDPTVKAKKPEKLKYPDRKIKYKHYGKSIEKLIQAAIDKEEGEEKTALVETIANMMKKYYLSWNRDTVKNEMLREQLIELSDGKLKLSDDFQFEKTSDILQVMGTNRSKSNNNQKKKKRHHKRRHKR